MPTITVDHVSKYYYPDRKGLFRIRRRRPKDGACEIGLEDVSFTVEQGEFVFIIGSSGAGKTTLMQLLCGQTSPDTGSVQVNGKDFSKIGKAGRQRLPLLVGYVSQQHSMDPRISIRENLEQAAKIGEKKFRKACSVEERIQKVLGLTGLAGTESRYPGELMTGERRRVELARALINSPPILVLDEVTANLDADSMWDMYLLLHEINHMGTTIIMSTHSSYYVNMQRRRVITLVDGRVYSDESKGRYGEVGKKGL